MDKRVTGIGGIFFKVKNPERLKKWYAEHLGLQTDQWGTNFETRQADDPSRKSFLQWSVTDENSKWFERPLMINYRVENLARLIEQLKAEGVTIVDGIEQYPYGKFAHILDGEGNKIELWEPDDVEYEKMVGGRTK